MDLGAHNSTVYQFKFAAFVHFNNTETQDTSTWVYAHNFHC